MLTLSFPRFFCFFFFFFFNDTATTEIYTLSLHDALPILHERTRRHNGCSAWDRADRTAGRVVAGNCVVRLCAGVAAAAARSGVHAPRAATGDRHVST